MSDEDKPRAIADIMALYVAKCPKITSHEFITVLQSITNAINSVNVPRPPTPPLPEVNPDGEVLTLADTVTGDYIICLEDGKKFKTMKRHLQTVYGMTPTQYRVKWNLPKDYPMTAPNYSLMRANQARANFK